MVDLEKALAEQNLVCFNSEGQNWMLEIDVYYEINTKGFLFGAARISIRRQALVWHSPSKFINNLGASGYAVFIAPILLLINRFRSPNHTGSIFNNHCSLIVSDLYLCFPPGFFSCGRISVSLWNDFSFQHSSFWTAQVLFQCRTCSQTICSSCFFGSLLFAAYDPSLKLPDIPSLTGHKTPALLNMLLGELGLTPDLLPLVSCLSWVSISSVPQDHKTISKVWMRSGRWTTARCDFQVRGWSQLQWDYLCSWGLPFLPGSCAKKASEHLGGWTCFHQRRAHVLWLVCVFYNMAIITGWLFPFASHY